jgi:glycosyltransferase involved in cell wall biosynthesis
MRILFDGQIFKLQKFGGISRYFTELIYEINQHSSHSASCPILYSENFHYNERIKVEPTFLDKIKLLFMLKFSKQKKDRYYIRKDKSSITNALENQKFDLFIPTYYDPYFLQHLKNKPFVLNVYDMIHEIFPSHFSDQDHTTKHKAELLNKATKIIAISQSTKRDILRFYPHIEASKIEVVYLSQSLDNKELLNLDLPKKYLLFVGNRGNYKNFIFFFRAIASILIANPDLYLVCAGGNSFDEEEIQFISSYGLLAQVIQRNFKDFELATYYTNAHCFVFPSAYEGFGIPVLESMNCGCPVILANHSSFPEVAGEAGIYFELDNEEDLRNKVSKVLFDDELRKEYSDKSRAQAKKFNWEKTANDCIEVFKSVLKN